MLINEIKLILVWCGSDGIDGGHGDDGDNDDNDHNVKITIIMLRTS
jgi:hypothetical protein